jgi:hypothetical protein
LSQADASQHNWNGFILYQSVLPEARRHAVRTVSKKHNFHDEPGTPGCRYKLSEAKRAKIVEEIREHRNFARRIAWKYRVVYKIVLALSREELRCPRFRAGYGEPHKTLCFIGNLSLLSGGNYVKWA